jgi:enoyl-CoA hydratase
VSTPAPSGGGGEGAETVVLEREGAIAWLRMNRPSALNAFDGPMVEEMLRCIAELAVDGDVRAAVLCGRGRSFCTGVDVKALAEGGIGVEWFRAWHEVIGALERLPMPLIVAAQGHALGGGLMLLLPGDLRIAGDDLRTGLNAVRHGILPGSAPQRLAGSIGALAARRLCLFCEYLNAEEALRLGLVDHVVPVAELEDHARASAERIAAFPPHAVRECKALLARAPRLDDAAYATAYLEAQGRCLRERASPEPPAPRDLL